MISHMGISVITSLPFGGGKGGEGSFSLMFSLFFLSQNYTDEQTSQRCTETLSQPITQSVSANDGCNVL